MLLTTLAVSYRLSFTPSWMSADPKNMGCPPERSPSVGDSSQHEGRRTEQLDGRLRRDPRPRTALVEDERDRLVLQRLDHRLESSLRAASVLCSRAHGDRLGLDRGLELARRRDERLDLLHVQVGEREEVRRARASRRREIGRARRDAADEPTGRVH
jgi:hypothetical protein